MPRLQRKASSFHLIFDNSIGFNSCIKIQSLLAQLNVIQYEHIALRKNMGDMTLRVSSVAQTDGIKPAPEPLGVIKNLNCVRHDGNIRQYLILLGFARLFLKQSHQDGYALSKSGNKTCR
jgi:hypothetical protein